MEPKPRLLRETAEIALTEIKRFLEPRLMEYFSLRRVSAPLYLPVDSDLLDPCVEGQRVEFSIAATTERMAIVTGLNRWLRAQLDRYGIASGFGVFTVMQALRPELPVNATSSPHVAAWAWQQALDAEEMVSHPELPARSREIVETAAHMVYRLMIETEKMILSKFPHLTPTLEPRMEVVSALEVRKAALGADLSRQIYAYMKSHEERPLFIVRDIDALAPCGQIVVWNGMLRCPLKVADIELSPGRRPSVGGNIYRDQLTLQLLHLTSILTPT